MGSSIILPKRSLLLTASTRRVVVDSLALPILTSGILVKISRPKTIAPLAWGALDTIRIRIVMELDGSEEHICQGQAKGGIRVNRSGIEVDAYELLFSPTYGFFGKREGFAVRLGERSRLSYQCRIEIDALAGILESDIEVIGFDAPAPQYRFSSSVAFDAATDAVETTGDGVLSLSHTSSGENLGAFAYSSNNSFPAGKTSSGTTYAGVSMTEKWDETWSSGNSGHAGYVLAGQATGAQTVTNTLSAAPANEHFLGVTSMTGVHQSVPAGTSATAQGTGTASSVTASDAATGDLVVDGVSQIDTGTTTAGADQTERWGQDTGQSLCRGSSQPGSAGGVMTWTFTGSNQWVAGAVAFKAVSALPVITRSMPQIRMHT